EIRNTGTFACLTLTGSSGTVGSPIRISNNMLISGGTSMSVGTSNYVDALHNSTSGSASISNGNSAVRLYNNSFYAGTGYALTVGTTGNIVASDHNCYHSTAVNAVLWSGAHEVVG